MEEKTLPAAAFFKGSGFFPDTEHSTHCFRLHHGPQYHVGPLEGAATLPSEAHPAPAVAAPGQRHPALWASTQVSLGPKGGPQLQLVQF